MTVLSGNIFSADRTLSGKPRLRIWVAMGTAAYGAKLVGNVHGSVNFAEQILTLLQKTSAQRTGDQKIVIGGGFDKGLGFFPSFLVPGVFYIFYKQPHQKNDSRNDCDS